MRNLKIMLFIVSFLSIQFTYAQETEIDSLINNDCAITLLDETILTGVILKQDEKEILIETEHLGKVSIPKYKIKLIERVERDDDGEVIEKVIDPIFATRYFLTTNGMSIPKGEVQAVFSVLGFDANYGITDNISVGLMSSWIGTPIIGNVKYTKTLGPKLHAAGGLLAGTGSLIFKSRKGILPYGALTFGDKRHNINFSAGYGKIWARPDSRDVEKSNQTAMFSIGAIATLNDRVSFVFDSFFFKSKNQFLDNGLNGFVTPGIRFASRRTESAFQFGFMNLVANGEVLPIPIPNVRYFRKF